MPITKTAIALLSALVLATIAAIIYFRRPITAAAMKAYATLATGYVPKPKAPATTAK